MAGAHEGSGKPPDDPESWTDDQWLAWLRATDEHDRHRASTTRPRGMVSRPAASALGAAMLGPRNAIYGVPDDDVVIVADAGGDPPADDFPRVHLDRDRPERSEVVVRARPSKPPIREH